MTNAGSMTNDQWRMTKRLTVVVLALLVVATPVVVSAQTTHLLIVVGLTTESEHDEVFKKWGTTLAGTATQKLGVPKQNVTLLGGPQATREAVVKALGTLATVAKPEDTVAIVLFGYGTFANKVAKFNLPGPDMTPQDFEPLLAHLKSKRVVFVNTDRKSTRLNS